MQFSESVVVINTIIGVTEIYCIDCGAYKKLKAMSNMGEYILECGHYIAPNKDIKIKS